MVTAADELTAPRGRARAAAGLAGGLRTRGLHLTVSLALLFVLCVGLVPGPFSTLSKASLLSVVCLK